MSAIPRMLAVGLAAVLGVAAASLATAGSWGPEGAGVGKVVEALRGKPGDTRTLVIEREGKRITVEARVSRLP